MDRNEADIRMKGVDDLSRLMVNFFDQMKIMNGGKMTEKDKEDMTNLLQSLRNLLEETYKRKVGFYNSIK